MDPAKPTGCPRFQGKEEDERQSSALEVQLDGTKRAQSSALAAEFPQLWQDPPAADRECRRIVRLLIEDVTLFQEGRTDPDAHPLQRRRPARSPPDFTALWSHTAQNQPVAIAEIDHLPDDYTEEQIAPILNAKGFRTGTG